MFGNLDNIKDTYVMSDVIPFGHINPFDLQKIPTPQLWESVVGGEKEDKVNHPSHYTSHPSGIECIEVTQHYNFCVGNAIKYLWRNGLKTEVGMQEKSKQIEDLKKAIWYINREIKNLESSVYE